MAMHTAGAAVTCVPVKLDQNQWETAVFFRVAGPESKRDRHILAKAERPLPVGMEADLLALEHAAVVTIRVEVFTLPDNPLTGEILITPGSASVQFDTLKLLSEQPRLSWFFSDQDFRVLHSQQSPLGSEQGVAFDDLLRDAVRHDALVRATAKYDAQAALGEVVEHYEFREGVSRAGAGAGRTSGGKPTRQ
ncbi:MAG: hypothetical protein ACE5K1_02115 [Acidiferrobacterales bacterium]